jgi:hypothetical protein
MDDRDFALWHPSHAGRSKQFSVLRARHPQVSRYAERKDAGRVDSPLGLRALISSSGDCLGTVAILLLGSVTTFVPLIVCTAVGTLGDSNV